MKPTKIVCIPPVLTKSSYHTGELFIRELYENFTTAKKIEYGICVEYKKYLGNEMDLMRMQIFKTKFQKKELFASIVPHGAF
jgi:hypothetical protein